MALEGVRNRCQASPIDSKQRISCQTVTSTFLADVRVNQQVERLREFERDLIP